MRTCWILTLHVCVTLALLISLSGCHHGCKSQAKPDRACQNGKQQARSEWQNGPTQTRLAAAKPHPSLLFNRYGSAYHPSQFAARSDWPAAPSMYMPAETVFYQEHFVDVQGRTLGYPNNTYRRVDTYRSGFGYR